ncbi:Hypothetical predicted protein, partial [Olea europaea subsp. europaea]
MKANWRTYSAVVSSSVEALAKFRPPVATIEATTNQPAMFDLLLPAATLQAIYLHLLISNNLSKGK